MSGSTRRRFLKTVGSIGAISLAGCSSNAGGGNSTTRIGFSTNFSGGSFVTAFRDGAKYYTQDRGWEWNFFGNENDAQKEIENVRQMTAQGYDAILVAPWNSETIAEPLQKAKDQGIRVFTLDIDALTPAVDLYVAFGQRRAAELGAERIMNTLRRQQPDRDTYRVLKVMAVPGQSLAERRHQPFATMMQNAPDFELVDTLAGEWKQSVSKQVVSEWLSSHEAPDAIFSDMFAMSVGALEALREADMAETKDSDSHILQGTFDAGPPVIPEIRDGYIDFAVDQTPHMYGPIALEYLRMVQESDSSDEVLPEAGTTITPDNLTLEPSEHKGVEMWSEPMWAPANVAYRDEYEHNHFQTAVVEVTQENADSPNLWGNIWG